MRTFLLILSILPFLSCFGQTEIDSLVNVGIQYHDQGEYEKAIEVYREALEIDPMSTLANYEMALSYISLGDNKNAIKYSDVVLKQKKGHLLPAYITKGSALDNEGKSKQAIKVFKEAIKKVGGHYLLYYNLGVACLKAEEYKNAESAFVDAIMENPNHAGSHYYLSIVKGQQAKRVESLLALYYFLLLENQSERSAKAYIYLQKQLGANVQKDKDDPSTIKLFLNSGNMDSEFAPVEMMLTLKEAASRSEENEGKTPEELFIDRTESFFLILGSLREKKKESNVWWDFYVPFYFNLVKAEHTDTFCYYISLLSNDKAEEWLRANAEKVDSFAKWLKENL